MRWRWRARSVRIPGLRGTPEWAYRSIPLPGQVVEALRERVACNLDETERLRSPCVFVSLEWLAEVARQMEARSQWYKRGTANLMNNLSAGYKQICKPP